MHYNAQELTVLGWDIYRTNTWVGRNRINGKKITAGTHLTLLHLLNYEEEMQ